MSIEGAWWAHLNTVRWFGGKGRDGAVTSVETVLTYPVAGVPFALTSDVATLDYADGVREYYHLLVARYPAGTAPAASVATVDGVDVVDATTDPDAVRALVRALADPACPGMEWRRDPVAVPDADVKVFAGEQSNTTVMLGAAALAKLFRKIEPGPNLDAEVLAALDDPDAATPALFGRLTAPWPDAGRPTDLVLVMERVADAEDGWELATAWCAEGRSFAGEAKALGRELRAVHERLAAAFGTDAQPGDALADTMTGRVHTAAETAEPLRPLVESLVASFDSLRGRDLPIQRVHGDFHLGQTLHSPAGWTIIDFEGEPAKTAEERRAYDSPWRDVAGMLRSFDYVRSAHAEPDSDAALTWASEAREAFLAGYCGPDGSPADVLGAYEVDKAVYEVVYETRNRPDWVSIPLDAVQRHARG